MIINYVLEVCTILYFSLINYSDKLLDLKIQSIFKIFINNPVFSNEFEILIFLKKIHVETILYTFILLNLPTEIVC